MASNGVYAGDRPPSSLDAELASDPAAGGFFATDFRKHDDLKNMLDSNKDGLKLEAMKRIIGMIAKGKDASELFPSVVKNVVSKNIEVKKLVYVYLVRYAEEQQDLALLSISTFQRALKDPNQLIRASALRVLSSIRVPVIVPIMMLAIKDAVNDMSPYVRKTAAHAIPKLYSLDPEQKEQLIEVIEKLLSDKTTLVVGSAVMAFEEVCPERIDLIHKNYRKLCSLLVDVEEWGQVVIINMLTRYARTQFTDPNQAGSITEDLDKGMKLYDSSESDEKESTRKVYVMDPDHRLLLRNCKPLLQSRNAAVVMGVAQLYYYLAPRNEVNLVAKPLIRLLHSHREIQSVVLTNVATISTKKKGMFEPYLKNFFVRSSDPTHIKLLKLEILTNLASESNISIILREFQTYVSSSDMEFVAATIQAIGRAACSIKEVTDTCLNGLVTLLSNRNETLVAESVVVIKKLLQMQPSEHKNIIAHMARLIDTITVPMARASILWLLGEYADRVPKIAPDVLRKVAKTFTSEEDIVKLQALNLGAKLCLTNSKQTRLLTQYVFSLAKYDQNYDIRDRARFLRQLIFPQGDKPSMLAKHAKKILLAQKPAPVLQSQFQERDQYQLGSLSHYINARAQGYHDIPDFPEVAPDPSVRNVEMVMPWQESQVIKKKRQVVKKKSFYSETDSSSSEESGEQKTSTEKSGNSTSESEESGSSMETSESEESESEDEDESEKQEQGVKDSGSESSTSEESSSEEEEDESSEEESSSASSVEASPQKKPKQPKKAKNNLDLLLDLDDFSSPSNVDNIPVSPTTILNPTAVKQTTTASSVSVISEVSVPALVPTKSYELLNRYHGRGLVATYRFTRSPNIYSPKMTSIELTFTNQGTSEIKGIHVPDKKQGGNEIKGFPEINSLAPNASISAPMSVDFNESVQAASFEVRTSEDRFPLSIKPPVGEMLQPVAIGEGDFTKEQSKLKGMNENTATVSLPGGQQDASPTNLAKRVCEVANVWQISSQTNASILRFSAQTLSTKSLVLVTVQILSNEKLAITVNCDKMVIGSMLLKDLKESLSK